MFAAPPPTGRRLEHIDDVHGVRVPDPYRWMEDIDSPETRAWVQSQVAHTKEHLAKLPGRDNIRTRLDTLTNYPTNAPVVVKRGGRLFYQRKQASQNQPVLFVRESSGLTRELLNPNFLSKEGTTAIATWQPSPDGRLIAYGIAKAGSDWQDWYVLDVATAKPLADHIEWIKFSDPEWSADSKGFYYGRYPKPENANLLTSANSDNKLYYHRTGTKQAEDTLIYERPDKREWGFDPWTSQDGRYLFVFARQGTGVERQVFYKDLRQPGAPFVTLIGDYSAEYIPVGNQGPVVYFSTTHRAPKSRIIAIDLRQPDPANWREIIPESKDKLEQAFWSAGHLICLYLRDAKNVAALYTLEGKFVREAALPGLGTVLWSGQPQQEQDQYFAYTGYTMPLSLYRYETKSNTATPLFEDRFSFDPSLYETQQVFYPSKDGTKIPMFLTARKGLQRNGNNPAFLYGYGGFSVSLKPAFSPLYIAWMDMGGIVAIVNLRGGGEYGEDWHRAGMKQNKQNVFDDFIAAGEWLIANKYTSREKLAINGASNGGLLVGAVLNQRPDLFGAAIPQVGVMDMLRFHKFTIGRAWTSDYGDPDDPQDFSTLLKYSPLQNIRKGAQYPPTLVMTADHDDRVVPSHSFKYGAALQAAQEGKAPILIRIETSAGHGAGKPKSKLIDEWTDMLAFLRESLKM
ncbi:MAG: S9 family peptidase [Acidobacteria bacterium]|nr:S9 family peptidase [Acidobacteriota bacterium]